MDCATGVEVGRVLSTRGELREWCEAVLGLRFPLRGVCPGHESPFEYLAHSYFEQRDVVVWAPRGGGKTRLGAAASLLDLLHKAPCSVRILGGSLDQSMRMWEHLWPDLMELAEGQVEGRAVGRRVRLVNGASAAVTCQSQCAVRGLRVQKLRCDEVELFRPEIWEAAQLVTRSGRTEDGRMVRAAVEALSTLHRPYGLMQQVVDRASERGVRVIKWCLMEVLARCEGRVCAGCELEEDCHGVAKTECDGFLEIEDAIAMKGRVSIEAWRSEMLCQRPVLTNSVFPSFDEDVHVREDAGGRSASALWMGVDFGFRYAFACLWIRRYEDGTVHVIDEYVKGQMTIAEHMKEVTARQYGRPTVGCDPAGSAKNDQTARSDVDVLRSAGYRVLTRHSEVIEGLNMIRTGLRPGIGRPTLYVHPRCKRLIQAMRCSRYPTSGGELPQKDNVHDHLVDALRYFYVNSVDRGVTGRRY